MRTLSFGFFILLFLNVAFAGESSKRQNDMHEFKGTIVEEKGILYFVPNAPLGAGYPNRVRIEVNYGSQTRARSQFEPDLDWKIVGRIFRSESQTLLLYIKELRVSPTKSFGAVPAAKEPTVFDIFC